MNKKITQMQIERIETETIYSVYNHLGVKEETFNELGKAELFLKEMVLKRKLKTIYKKIEPEIRFIFDDSDDEEFIDDDETMDFIRNLIERNPMEFRSICKLFLREFENIESEIGNLK